MLQRKVKNQVTQECLKRMRQYFRCDNKSAAFDGAELNGFGLHSKSIQNKFTRLHLENLSQGISQENYSLVLKATPT